MTGSTPSAKATGLWDGAIPFITPGDVKQSLRVSQTERSVSELGVAVNLRLPPRSIVVTCIGNIGRVGLTTQESCTNQQINAVVPNEAVHPEYLLHVLAAPDAQAQMMAAATSTTLPILNKSRFSMIEVPLPPIEEQRRIAAILDKADELRTKRRAALAQLDTLTEAIFIDMFGDPASNPKGWETYRLGDLCTLFAGASLPDGGEVWVGQPGGYFHLKVSDLNRSGNEREIWSAGEWSVSAGARSATSPANAIVIPKRGGAIATNKKRMTTRACILDPNLMALSADDKRVSPLWLFQWFLQFDLLSLVSGSSVPQLNKQDLDPLAVHLPPLELQNEFAKWMGSVDKVRAEQKQSLSLSGDLFVGLQHRAFAGAL